MDGGHFRKGYAAGRNQRTIIRWMISDPSIQQGGNHIKTPKSKIDLLYDQAETELKNNNLAVYEQILIKIARLYARAARVKAETDIKDAIKLLEMASWWSPFTKSHYLLLARLHTDAGEEEKAREYKDLSKIIERTGTFKTTREKLNHLLYHEGRPGIFLATRAMYVNKYPASLKIALDWVKKYPQKNPVKIREVYYRAPLLISMIAQKKPEVLESYLTSDLPHVRDTIFRSLVKIQGLTALKKHHDYIQNWENLYNAPVSMSIFTQVNTGDIFWEEIGKDLLSMTHDIDELIDYVSGLDFEQLPHDFYIWTMNEGLLKAVPDMLTDNYHKDPSGAKKRIESLLLMDQKTLSTSLLAYAAAEAAAKINNQDIYNFLWEMIDSKADKLYAGRVGKIFWKMKDRFPCSALQRIMLPQYEKIRKPFLSGMSEWKTSSFMNCIEEISGLYSGFPQDRKYIFKYIFQAKSFPPELQDFMAGHLSDVRSYLQSLNGDELESCAKKLKKSKKQPLLTLAENMEKLTITKYLQEAKQTEDTYTCKKALKGLRRHNVPSAEPLFWSATESLDVFVVCEAMDGLFDLYKSSPVDLYPRLVKVITAEKITKSDYEGCTSWPVTEKLLDYCLSQNTGSLGKIVRHIVNGKKVRDAILLKKIRPVFRDYMKISDEKKLAPQIERCPGIGEILIENGLITSEFIDLYRSILSHKDQDVRITGERAAGVLKDSLAVPKLVEILFNPDRIEPLLEYNQDPERQLFIMMSGKVDPESGAILTSLGQIGTDKSVRAVIDFALADLEFMPNFYVATRTIITFADSVYQPCLNNILTWTGREKLEKRGKEFVRIFKKTFRKQLSSMDQDTREQFLTAKNKVISKLAGQVVKKSI
ncbi:MAG: hypothetical protein JW904_01290 [Spirochaetales bacterium]|nr:hypothetical protein [Spirochaetales bacterium]